MVPKKIVHVGVGAWGQKYLKTYEAFPIEVSVATRDTWQAMIVTHPDGVVVCTPPDTHIEIARFALEHGIPVMIEKPLALSLAEAQSLLSYTPAILVNHIYLFSQAYQKLKQDTVGKRMRRIETVGTGAKGHEGYSTLWDYGPHDIAMILDIVEQEPERVFAKEKETPEGSAFEVELYFDEIVTCSFFGISVKRERRVSVEYETRSVFFEDTGTEIPAPLSNAVGVFLGALAGKPDPRLGLTLSLQVLRVLEACERSLRKGAIVAY